VKVTGSMARATLTRGKTRRAAPTRPARRRHPAAAPAATEPVTLDELVEHWWTALAAADSALHAVARMPGGRGLAQSTHPLAAERAETMRLLQQYGHELHEHSRLLPWLAVPSVTNRMLGLPAPVTACIFDLDGVLTTSDEVHSAAWTETLDPFLLEQADRHHRPYIPFDRRHDYEGLVAERPRRDGVRSFLAARGISLPEGAPNDAPGTETVNGLANRKNQLFRQHLEREGVAAFEGSRAYLEAARMAGLGRAVVSPSANTAAILDRAGLTSLLDARVDGSTLEAQHLRSKPAPDTLVAACRLLGIDPGRAAAFETTPAGVAAARAARIGLVVGVHRAGDGEVLRASDADLVVGDLSELFGDAAGS
jgi:HAD superfamily hydrolase (TIGR01509 family)